ncbi:hypothetical protein NC652_030184 [Populus alba x Populus x berolinensis]|nr:hypothetical protein NC652_030184 [Populus alba x Populus x berolinensis]
MFESTVELIAQAASNSLVIFCFCNLIIVMILMGSKPVSNFGQESEIPQSKVTKTHTKVREDVLAMPSLDGNKKPSLDEDKMSTDDGRVDADTAHWENFDCNGGKKYQKITVKKNENYCSAAISRLPTHVLDGSLDFSKYSHGCQYLDFNRVQITFAQRKRRMR